MKTRRQLVAHYKRERTRYQRRLQLVLIQMPAGGARDRSVQYLQDQVALCNRELIRLRP